MQTDTLTSDNANPLDTAGRPITPVRLRRAMRLNIAAGAMGMAWCAACAPGAILEVFVKNQLGASATTLGLLVAITQLAMPLQLAAIFIFGRLKTRKGFWVGALVIHRLLAFAQAGVAVYAAQRGDKELGVAILMVAVAGSWILMCLSTPGWWSWISDLIPENIRGTFFGRRSAIIHLLTMFWFFGIQVALDKAAAADSTALFYTYAAVFGVGGLLGVLDILLHIRIPEPRKHKDEPQVGWRQFVQPLKSRNFMTFSIAIGLWTFSVGVLGPFVAPYITAADQIGAPYTWLGIMFVITQVTWIFTGTQWGVVMDRFGRKPAVLLGALHPLVAWVGYFFLTPNNYTFILPVTALVVGILGPGYWVGISTLMLTLAPQRNRTAFIAWHAALVGLIAAAGPIVGGLLNDALLGFHATIPGGFTLGNFHVVALVSFGLCALSLVMLSRIREGRERPVGFVVSRLATPGIFRTFLNISLLGGAATSRRTARALRSVEGASSDLAVADILGRLDDPDHEVREEAARALGRIGSPDAVEALLERLGDPHSAIRPQAARALGQIGDPRAVPTLVEGLASRSEEVQEACAQALGAIGGRDSVGRLMRLLGEKRADRVIVSGAEAVSKHGVIEAAWEILPRMHATKNPVLRRQLAIAMGNLLGRPGEFYQFLTGERAQEGARLGPLFRRARRSLAAFRRGLRRQRGPLDALEGLSPDAARTLIGELDRVRGLMEGQSYRAAFEGLHGIIGRLVRTVVRQDLPDERALEYAFGRDARLGLGFWFVIEVKQRMGTISDPELLHTDALLALYFLSTYRLPTEG